VRRDQWPGTVGSSGVAPSLCCIRKDRHACASERTAAPSVRRLVRRTGRFVFQRLTCRVSDRQDPKRGARCGASIQGGSSPATASDTKPRPRLHKSRGCKVRPARPRPSECGPERLLAEPKVRSPRHRKAVANRLDPSGRWSARPPERSPSVEPPRSKRWCQRRCIAGHPNPGSWMRSMQMRPSLRGWVEACRAYALRGEAADRSPAATGTLTGSSLERGNASF